MSNFGKVRLPRARVSEFPLTPARPMGTGPGGGKSAGPGPELPFFAVPSNGLGYQNFSEIFRQPVRGYSRGRIIVGADVTVSPTTAGAFVAPFLFVDVQIVGYTNGVGEVMAYGAPGSLMQGLDLAFGSSDPAVINMDAPPVQAEWEDSFGYDEVAVLIRSMGNGGQPFGAGWFPTIPGDIINVNIAGKLWR
jgi:hypothetical protein